MSKNKPPFRPSQPPNRNPKFEAKPTDASGSTNREHPIFSLEYLGGDYCLSKCTTGEKVAFVDRLHALSRMTWGDIYRAPRHGFGCETIERSAIGTRSLPSEMSEDVALLVFRFYGKAPMVGYRKDRVFFVLFLDRDFTLYKH
jgi:hypothetical protein